MWKDIKPGSRDYKIGKLQASWHKLVIRHAQGHNYKATGEIRKDKRFNDLPIIAMIANAMAGDGKRLL